MTHEIRAVASDRDREAVRALLRSEFEVAPGVGAAFSDLYDDLLDHDPSVSYECSRVALEKGNVVGHALLAPRDIRICEGDCPAGLIGLVVVHPAFQGIGVGTALIEDVHRVARERALGLMVLAGDPAFYNRFGYRDTFVKTECVLAVKHAHSAVTNTLRPAALTDLDSLVKLSARSVPSGSVSPSSERWEWILKTGHPVRLLETNPVMLGHLALHDRCLIDEEGAGYVRIAIGDERATVYEAGLVRGAEKRMLGQILALCGQEGVRELNLRLSPENGLVRVTEQPARIQPDVEFQFKIIDLDVLLEVVQPGLEGRIERGFPGWKGGILIQTESSCIHVCRESGSLELRNINEGQSAVASSGSIRIPEWGVGRSLMGQDDLIRALESSETSTDLDLALGALFRSPLPEFLLSDAI
jgi:putative acetyltransferase